MPRRRLLLKYLGVREDRPLDEDFFRRLFQEMDADGDGNISFEEFIMHLAPPPLGTLSHRLELSKTAPQSARGDNCRVLYNARRTSIVDSQ